MKSKWFVFLSVLALASLVLTACGGAGGAAQPMKSLGKGEGEVDIIAWAGYIERGESDPAYDWVTAFEKETGCKVNVKVAATSDEMVAMDFSNGRPLWLTAGFGLTSSNDRRVALVALPSPSRS